MPPCKDLSLFVIIAMLPDSVAEIIAKAVNATSAGADFEM
jgi:hypothetical protein